jgi:integrase
LATGLNRHGAGILARHSDSRDAGGVHFPVKPRHCDQHEQFSIRGLKEAGRNAGIDGVTHQMLRRTCSTYMAQITSVKDVQARLRHTNAKTTREHYIKSVPESVRVAVESLDQLLKKKPSGSGTPAIEPI